MIRTLVHFAHIFFMIAKYQYPQIFLHVFLSQFRNFVYLYYLCHSILSRSRLNAVKISSALQNTNSRQLLNLNIFSTVMCNTELPTFQISQNFPDFNMESKFSFNCCYFPLFKKSDAQKKKKGRKSRILSNSRS